MFKHIILIGIDGLGIFYKNSNAAPYLNKFFEKGSVIIVNANEPTDSAPNWGSIITGVIPYKHKFKYEYLQGPYSCDYKSIFNLISTEFTNYKLAAFASWEKIITGMIEPEIKVAKYAPKLDENLISKFMMYVSHYWFKNSIYDYYLVNRIRMYLKRNGDVNFLFIHLDDLDEIGHIYGFESQEYYGKLKQTDSYVNLIVEDINKYVENALIIITTDHGGVGKSHGGSSEKEKTVFVGSNHDLNNFSININSNMSCAELVLKNFDISVPTYFDKKPQKKNE